MKRISMLLMLGVLVLVSFMGYSADLTETEIFTPEKIYPCAVGNHVTVELPEGSYKILSGENDYWYVEGIRRFVWVSPKIPGADFTLKIRSRQKSLIEIKFKSTDSGSRDSYRIVVNEFPAVEILPKGRGSSLDTEFELSLDGGLVQAGKGKNRLHLRGESILAARSGRLFTQGACKVEMNDLMRQYGFSLGAGYEYRRLGLFLFADGLMYGYDDRDTTLHVQVRPALRFRSRHLTGALFYARGITGDRYVGKDVLVDGVNFGIYHRTIDHLGIDLGLNVADKVYLDLRSIVGKGLFKLDLSSRYQLLDNLTVNVGCAYTDSGDLNIYGYERYSYFYAGLTMGLASRSRLKDSRKRIIFRPDYPLIATVKKQRPDEGEQGLKVELTAQPEAGPVPLSVDFRAGIEGGIPPYEVQWNVDGKLDGQLKGESVRKVFQDPGDHQVYVTVTDAHSLQAGSNTVFIEVSETNNTESENFTIAASAGDGGSIDPTGTVKVKRGTDQKFFMKPDAGYRVIDVVADDRSEGPLSAYEFKDVQEDHAIRVTFGQSGDRAYSITSTAGTGGNISPAGSVTVIGGKDASFTVTPEPGCCIKDVRVDRQSRGALAEYTFAKVAGDHTIHAEFEEKELPTHTITATAGTGGRTDPAGTVTVDEGSDLTIRIIPETGYQIADVQVDSKSVGSVAEYHFTNITGSHTLHAEFSTKVQPTCTISATAGTGGDISPQGTVTVVEGNDAHFTMTPSTGFRIKEVRVDGVSRGIVSGYTFTNVNGDHTIHVDFERITHAVTASAGAGGRIDPAGTITVNEGDDLTVRIIPDAGYRISDVRVDNHSVGAVPEYTFNNLAADHTIYAEFELKTYTITAAAGTGGGIEPAGTVVVQHGSNRTFTITPLTGYKIRDVVVDNQSQGPVSTYTFRQVAASHTIRAEFELKTFVIQASSGTGGTIRPSGTITVEYGGSQQFVMESNYPLVWEMDRVMVDGSSQGAILKYTFDDVTADHTIRALWKKKQYKVEASCTEGGSIVPSGTRWYEAQAAPTYIITPDTGYVVERVVIDGTYNTGAVRSYTFDPILSDKTIRAYFKLKTYTVAVSKRYSDGSTGTPPNPISPLGTVTVNHGDDLSINIDNHYQGGGGSVIYSLDYITVNGASFNYRGDAKMVIVHTIANIMENKTVICYFYQRTN